VIWLDLDLPQVCPKSLEASIWPLACQLKCNDPCIVVQYNKTLVTILNMHNVPQWLQCLDNTLQRPTDLCCCYCTELNMINNIVTNTKYRAENQCCKLKSGNISWCPQVTRVINKILFWQSMGKWELGGHVVLLVLCTWEKRAGLTSIPYPGKYSIPAMQELISINKSGDWKRTTIARTHGYHHSSKHRQQPGANPNAHSGSNSKPQKGLGKQQMQYIESCKT